MTLLATTMLSTEYGLVRVADRPGSGAPLVFVHGYPDNLQIWSRVFAEPALADRRLIAFDWPGLGHSSTFVGGATPFHLGRHLIAVLDALELDRAIPVGFDMGAHAVVAAADKLPNRFDRLVLTNFLADGNIETSWDIAAMRRLGLNRLVLKWAPRVVFERAERTFLEDGPLPQGVRDDIWTGFSDRESLAHLRRMCAGYQAALPRFTRLLGGLEKQTLVIWADSDPHFPVAQANALADALATAHLEFLVGASHWFMWERSEQLAFLIADFVNGSGSSCH